VKCSCTRGLARATAGRPRVWRSWQTMCSGTRGLGHGHLGEEREELLVAMPREAGVGDLAGGHLEGGEQRRRARGGRSRGSGVRAGPGAPATSAGCGRGPGSGSTPPLSATAARLGLDVPRFQRDDDDPAIAAAVDADEARDRIGRIGVTGISSRTRRGRSADLRGRSRSRRSSGPSILCCAGPEPLRARQGTWPRSSARVLALLSPLSALLLARSSPTPSSVAPSCWPAPGCSTWGSPWCWCPGRRVELTSLGDPAPRS